MNQGLSTKAGDEFYVLIYVNNGAVDNAEERNPGHGIARNVAITTRISDEDAATHYINVGFSRNNTNTVANRFDTTEPHGRLEQISKSGEIFNSITTELVAKISMLAITPFKLETSLPSGKPAVSSVSV